MVPYTKGQFRFGVMTILYQHKYRPTLTAQTLQFTGGSEDSTWFYTYNIRDNTLLENPSLVLLHMNYIKRKRK